MATMRTGRTQTAPHEATPQGSRAPPAVTSDGHSNGQHGRTRRGCFPGVEAPTGKTLRSPETKFSTQKRSAGESHSFMAHELEPESLTDSQNTRQDRPAVTEPLPSLVTIDLTKELPDHGTYLSRSPRRLPLLASAAIEHYFSRPPRILEVHRAPR